MSLINDALKRASQCKPPPPPVTPEPVPPLQPAEHRRPSNLPLLTVPVIFILALAGWFFVKGWQATHRAGLPVTTTPIAARELPPEVTTAQLQVQVNVPGNPKNSLEQASTQPNPAGTGLSVTPVEAKTNLAPNALSPGNLPPSEPSKPAFPAVRLQGIFYHPTHPSVLINAKTVFIGDKVANAKVVAITSESVTLQWNGETNVLTLE